MVNIKPYLGIVLILAGLGFSIFLAVYVVPKIFVSFTKAAPATKISLSNSYLIGGDILAKADGVDICTVNVFVLDKNSQGVKGIVVTLNGMEEGELQTISGADGKAVFELSSTKEGQYELTANINGVPLDKTIRVTFRN
jgi:hypothetical protein